MSKMLFDVWTLGRRWRWVIRGTPYSTWAEGRVTGISRTRKQAIADARACAAALGLDVDWDGAR